MHTFAIVENIKGRSSRRYFFNADLPTNPICALFGHRRQVVVVKPRYIAPWQLIRCRVCDRRHSEAEGGYGPRWLELAASLYAYKPSKARLTNGGFRLHIGSRSSETPLDAHLDLGIVAAYFQVGGIGGRWCEWIGRGHGRDLSLTVHGGQVWWKLWYDGDGGNDEHHRCDKWRQPKVWPWSAGLRKYRSWQCLRNGSAELNPVSAFYGSVKYDHQSIGRARTALVAVGQCPDDEYTVEFTLQHVQRRRAHGPQWARRITEDYYAYDAECDSGIPVQNHDWKGDEITGWSGRLEGWTPAVDFDWLAQAVESTIEIAVRNRKHYAYRPPQPETQVKP